MIVSGWSRAQNVNGTPDTDYSLYTDITYQDGNNLWGQAAPFRTGTHGWQRVEFLIQPQNLFAASRSTRCFVASTRQAGRGSPTSA